MWVGTSRPAKEGNTAVDQGGHIVLPGRGGGQPEQPGEGKQGGQSGVWQGHQQKVLNKDKLLILNPNSQGQHERGSKQDEEYRAFHDEE